MALTWNLEAIEDHRDVCWVESDLDEEGNQLYRLNPVTESLIWMTIPVKLGEITEKNAGEFYARLKMIERMNGPMMWHTDDDGHKVDDYFTAEMVRSHIGLATNVGNETRQKFLSGFKFDLDRDVHDYTRTANIVAAAS